VAKLKFRLGDPSLDISSCFQCLDVSLAFSLFSDRGLCLAYGVNVGHASYCFSTDNKYQVGLSLARGKFYMKWKSIPSTLGQVWISKYVFNS
jgi:hypothetical protein